MGAAGTDLLGKRPPRPYGLEISVSTSQIIRPPIRSRTPARLAPRQWFRRLNALRGSHRNFWLALTAVLVLGGTLASVLGARAVAGSEAQKAKLASHLASNEIASTLKLAIQHEEDLVISASAYVTGNPLATPADFDSWANSVQAMRRYPELQNIGLVKLVPAASWGTSNATSRPTRCGRSVPTRWRPKKASRCCPPAVAPTTASPSPGWQGAPPPTSPGAPTTARWRRR